MGLMHTLAWVEEAERIDGVTSAVGENVKVGMAAGESMCLTVFVLLFRSFGALGLRKENPDD